MRQNGSERKPKQLDPTEIPADEARQRLGDLIDRVWAEGERFTITRHGKPVATLIGHKDFAQLVGATT